MLVPFDMASGAVWGHGGSREGGADQLGVAMDACRKHTLQAVAVPLQVRVVVVRRTAVQNCMWGHYACGGGGPGQKVDVRRLLTACCCGGEGRQAGPAAVSTTEDVALLPCPGVACRCCCCCRCGV